MDIEDIQDDAVFEDYLEDKELSQGQSRFIRTIF
jgi:hypothetical protein